MIDVGFVGLGSIGYPIFEKIVNAGFNVSFYARRPEVIEKAVSAGGIYVNSVAELANNKIVIIFVNNYLQCVECVDALLTRKNDGIIVIGSTISPSEMRSLGDMCSEQGVSILAAPVTGGVRAALTGSLTVITSGDNNIIDICTPVFATYAVNIIRAGDNMDDAQKMKALNQLLVGINAVAMAEVFVLGQKAGLDLNIIYDTLVKGAGYTRLLENRGPLIINRDFKKRGTIEIMNKDLAACGDLAKEAGAPFLLGDIVENIYKQTYNDFDPMEDLTAVIRVYEEKANMKNDKQRSDI
jgi:3-hydroxyisobutyrate dehydrogenase-like beta-hydroxyacid dehydrogenase